MAHARLSAGAAAAFAQALGQQHSAAPAAPAAIYMSGARPDCALVGVQGPDGATVRAWLEASPDLTSPGCSLVARASGRVVALHAPSWAGSGSGEWFVVCGLWFSRSCRGEECSGPGVRACR